MIQDGHPGGRSGCSVPFCHRSPAIASANFRRARSRKDRLLRSYPGTSPRRSRPNWRDRCARGAYPVVSNCLPDRPDAGAPAITKSQIRQIHYRTVSWRSL